MASKRYAPAMHISPEADAWRFVGVVEAHFAMLPECTYRRVRKDVMGFSRTDCGT